MSFNNLKTGQRNLRTRKLGEDLAVTITFPYAITGFSFLAKLKKAGNNNSDLSLTIEQDNTNKIIVIKADSTILDAIDRGTYRWELWQTDTVPFDACIIEGNLDLTS